MPSSFNSSNLHFSSSSCSFEDSSQTMSDEGEEKHNKMGQETISGMENQWGKGNEVNLVRHRVSPVNYAVMERTGHSYVSQNSQLKAPTEASSVISQLSTVSALHQDYINATLRRRQMKEKTFIKQSNHHSNETYRIDKQLQRTNRRLKNDKSGAEVMRETGWHRMRDRFQEESLQGKQGGIQTDVIVRDGYSHNNQLLDLLNRPPQDIGWQKQPSNCLSPVGDSRNFMNSTYHHPQQTPVKTHLLSLCPQQSIPLNISTLTKIKMYASPLTVKLCGYPQTNDLKQERQFIIQSGLDRKRTLSVWLQALRVRLTSIVDDHPHSYLTSTINHCLPKKSRHIGRWQQRFITIEASGLLSRRTPQTVPTMKLERNTLTEMWTRFDLISKDGNKWKSKDISKFMQESHSKKEIKQSKIFLVVKIKAGKQRQQIGVPIGRDGQKWLTDIWNLAC